MAPPCAAALGCSVAAVQQAGPLELLVSTGHGALVLLSGADSGAAPAVSAAAQPLPQAQPFVLEPPTGRLQVRSACQTRLSGPTPAQAIVS